MTRRQEKVSDQLQEELAELLLRQVKHPVLAEAIVSITHVEVSADLARARVFVSVLGGDPAEETEVQAAFERSEPFLHRELVRRLHMRRVPHMRFIIDHSIADGARLTALMRELAEAEGRPREA